jgi:hypothetical protein
MDLDLDAEREEITGEPKRVIFGGETFELPETMTLDIVEALATGSLTSMLAGVLGEKQYARFKALGATRDDGLRLIAGLDELYGADEGNSSASSGPSGVTSGRSRRTSGGTTASTSAKRSGAAKKS